MNLQRALEQIDGIHLQMQRTRVFRGYRSITTLVTACFAALGALIQPVLVANPASHPIAFVSAWVAVAGISLSVISVEIAIRFRKCNSPLQRELTIHAIEQFLPCIVVVALVTLTLTYGIASEIHLLPGLWSILFGMGILASRRLLPKAIWLLGIFYITCGVPCLILPADLAFSPWVMGGIFVIGQSASAAVLYWNLERSDELGE
jgi:hypothetical protein